MHGLPRSSTREERGRSAIYGPSFAAATSSEAAAIDLDLAVFDRAGNVLECGFVGSRKEGGA